MRSGDLLRDRVAQEHGKARLVRSDLGHGAGDGRDAALGKGGPQALEPIAGRGCQEPALPNPAVAPVEVVGQGDGMEDHGFGRLVAPEREQHRARGLRGLRRGRGGSQSRSGSVISGSKRSPKLSRSARAKTSTRRSSTGSRRKS